VKAESGWNDINGLRKEVRSKYAKVHLIDEEAWLGIF